MPAWRRSPTGPVTVVLVADGSMWLVRWLQNFVAQLQFGRVEPVECQSRRSQMLTTWDGSSRCTEIAEIGWSDTMNTLPDHQDRPEDYSLTNRQPMQIFKNWGDVFTSVQSRHHTSSHVLHRVVCGQLTWMLVTVVGDCYGGSGCSLSCPCLLCGRRGDLVWLNVNGWCYITVYCLVASCEIFISCLCNRN